MRVAPACAVLAALAVVGCSASQSLSASALSGSGPSRSSGTPGSPAASASSAAGASSATATAQSPNGTGTATAATSGGGTGGGTVGGNGGIGNGTGGTATTDGNITIAAAGDLQPGPVKITPVYCGTLSAAQQAQFRTTATGGLIYRSANHSGSAVEAKLLVEFTDGTTVAGENYTGTVPDIAPGKSAEEEIDAFGISGQNLKFTGCEVESYSVTSNLGVDPVSYAGLRSTHGRHA